MSDVDAATIEEPLDPRAQAILDATEDGPEPQPDPPPAPDEGPPEITELAPAEPGAEEQLFAGKYHSIAEFEKGYAELQRRLSAGEHLEPPEEAEEEYESDLQFWPGDTLGPPTNEPELRRMYEADPKACFDFVNSQDGSYIPEQLRELVNRSYAEYAGPEFYQQQLAAQQQSYQSQVASEVQQIVEPILVQMQHNNVAAATQMLQAGIPDWASYSDRVAQAWVDGEIVGEPQDLHDPKRIAEKSLSFYLALKGREQFDREIAAYQQQLAQAAGNGSGAPPVVTNGDAPGLPPGDLVEVNGQLVSQREAAIILATPD